MNSTDRERALLLAPKLLEIENELAAYEKLLRKWQGRINLVSSSTLDSIWTRHFADSLQLADFGPEDRVWADLGSGAGFPGMVVALHQTKCSAGEMHLIESDTRKAAFLREVSRETGARVTIHNCRCEDLLPTIAPEVVTSRAMTNLADLIALCQPLVENGAIGLFLKGRDIGSELTVTPRNSNFSLELFPSKIDPAGSIVRLRAA